MFTNGCGHFPTTRGQRESRPQVLWPKDDIHSLAVSWNVCCSPVKSHRMFPQPLTAGPLAQT